MGTHSPIKVRVYKETTALRAAPRPHRRATVGRLIFNVRQPQDLGFVDRSDPSRSLILRIMFTCGKKELADWLTAYPRTRLPHYR